MLQPAACASRVLCAARWKAMFDLHASMCASSMVRMQLLRDACRTRAAKKLIHVSQSNIQQHLSAIMHNISCAHAAALRQDLQAECLQQLQPQTNNVMPHIVPQPRASVPRAIHDKNTRHAYTMTIQMDTAICCTLKSSGNLMINGLTLSMHMLLILHN